MSVNNDNKATHQQDVLDYINSEIFVYQSYMSDEQSLFHNSNIYRYGFAYNVGQHPTLDDDLEDYKPIVELLRTAKNNDYISGETNFPDWICSNGLIEHFQVSATKGTRKGYKSKTIADKFDRELQKVICDDMNNDTLKKCYYTEYNMPNESIDNFIKSFKNKWASHIEKLHKFRGNKNTVCFLIESDCFGLKQEVVNDIQYEIGIETGRIIENYSARGETFRTIMIGRCKEILNYIAEYSDDVQYVIFKTPYTIEILKTDKALYISSLLKEYKYSIDDRELNI